MVIIYLFVHTWVRCCTELLNLHLETICLIVFFNTAASPLHFNIVHDMLDCLWMAVERGE